MAQKTKKLSHSVVLASDADPIAVQLTGTSVQTSTVTPATPAAGPTYAVASTAVPTGPTGGVALAGTGHVGVREIWVQADKANGATIFIGTATLTSAGGGISLEAGERVVLPCSDPSTLHAISATGGNKVSALVF